MMHSQNLDQAAELLKAVAHPGRLHILQLFSDYERLCVSEITEKTGQDQPTVSHHLILMKDRGILSSGREGQKVFYSLAIPQLLKLLECVNNCF
ncbi:MAG: metalloregulator ArsR/SmtB family transcription factor [Ignavibacteriaceae bacterium]|nr:metalloregulator ArsR/SmtB family transcription factor [Ignavibacteriaceae bacterium]